MNHVNFINSIILRLGKKCDWDFRICDLVKNPDETDLTSVVNFEEVRSTQLAKSTLLTSTLGPLGSFQIF